MKFIENNFYEGVIRVIERDKVFEESLKELIEEHLKVKIPEYEIRVSAINIFDKLICIRINEIDKNHNFSTEDLMKVKKFLKGEKIQHKRGKNYLEFSFEECNIFDDVVQVSYFKLKGE